MAAVTDADKLRKMISEAKRGGWSDWLGLALTLRAVAEPLAEWFAAESNVRERRDQLGVIHRSPSDGYLESRERLARSYAGLFHALSAALKEQQP